jgi:hypothetical protein
VEGQKTPLIVGLILLILVAVGIFIYQLRGSSTLSQDRQEGIAARQPGAPGSFTPAPR